MKLPISARQLEKMKLEARGNPQKIAEYSMAKQRYEDMIKQYFNDETPFVSLPADWYLQQLEEKAKSGNPDDVMRYLILKERRDMHEYEASGQDARDIRQAKHELQTKLMSGEKLTQRDLRIARELALKISSVDNLVLYSKVKQAIEQQPEGQVEVVTESGKPSRVTKEMVDEAYQHAKKTGRIDDQVRYSVLKREFELQESERASE